MNSNPHNQQFIKEQKETSVCNFRTYTVLLGKDILQAQNVWHYFIIWVAPESILSHDVVSESDITPCNKIDGPESGLRSK